jgi:hypothetical protein
MGTAAAECCEERPGDGESPGACATDQITPERPEERLRLGKRLSRRVKLANQIRVGRTGGGYCPGPRRVVPRGGARASLVPLAKLSRTLEV